MEVLSGLASHTSHVITFLWGFFGSCSVEIVTLYNRFGSETPIPLHYKQFPFWALRLLMAAIGGLLAIAAGIDNNPMMSMYVGASAPLIIQKFSKGEKIEQITGSP
jgi:hypothetical protein